MHYTKHFLKLHNLSASKFTPVEVASHREKDLSEA